MTCDIRTQRRSTSFPHVTSVTIPAPSGEMEILPGHAEAFIVLSTGEITIAGSNDVNLAIIGGVCHVVNDQVSIALVDAQGS